MGPVEIRIARRLAIYMKSVAEQKVDLEFFQGIGMALAVVFEESTGRSAISVKPRDLLDWADSLPHERYPHVKD